MERLWSPWRSEYIETLRSPDEKCVFCDIAKRENEDDKVFVVQRRKHNYIVMNIYPYNNGHMLVVPYEHVDNITKLSTEVLNESMFLLKSLTTVLTNIFKPQGFNLGLNLGEAAGAGIHEHLHFHIVPRWMGDSNFMPVLGKTKVISTDLKNGFEKIRDEINRLYPI
ncbi:MAG: HIT domain-containing protein [bacterium]|nr:HIT domain-containing protein [bacterium]